MWKVYSVKSLYRTATLGKPDKIDNDFRDNIDLIEERIITIKARSFNEAIAKGEKEASRYASGTDYLNPYGQRVTQKYIGSIDAYEPFEDIKENIEVFSSTYLINKSMKNSEIINNCMGRVYKDDHRIRKIFFSAAE